MVLRGLEAVAPADADLIFRADFIRTGQMGPALRLLLSTAILWMRVLYRLVNWSGVFNGRAGSGIGVSGRSSTALTNLLAGFPSGRG